MMQYCISALGALLLAAGLSVAVLGCDSATKRQKAANEEAISSAEAASSADTPECAPGELVVVWPPGWATKSDQGVLHLKREQPDHEDRVDVRYSWLEGADDSDLRRDPGALNRFYDLLGDVSTSEVRVVSAWFLLPGARLGGEVQIHRLDTRVAAPMASLEFADIEQEQLELLVNSVLSAKVSPIAPAQQGAMQRGRCREVAVLKAESRTVVNGLAPAGRVVEALLKASSQPAHHLAIPQGKSSSDYPKIRVAPVPYAGPGAPSVSSHDLWPRKSGVSQKHSPP